MKPIRAKPTATNRTRVLVVDDHPFLRRGVAQLLNGEDWLTVCGEAASAEQALSMVEKLEPDVVITDLTLSGKGGLELIKDLAVSHPKLPVIVLSMHDEQLYAERCLRAGARGYVMKQASPDTLLVALREILAGGAHVSQQVLAGILDHFAGQRHTERPISRLTDREFEIFQLVGEGKTSKQIARQLHLSPKTVDCHRANISQKLSMRRASELLRYAVRWVETEGHGPSPNPPQEQKRNRPRPRASP